MLPLAGQAGGQGSKESIEQIVWQVMTHAKEINKAGEGDRKFKGRE